MRPPTHAHAHTNTHSTCRTGKKPFRAVKDQYMIVEKDKLLCLLGPNGAGKRYRNMVTHSSTLTLAYGHAQHTHTFSNGANFLIDTAI